jgi:hypothetical protein
LSRKTRTGRWLTLTAMVVAILTIGAVAAPPASASSAPNRAYTLSFQVSDPLWMGRLDYLLKTMEEDGSLDRLGLSSTATAASGRPLTKAETERVARANHAQYTIDSRHYKSTLAPALAPSYDYITRDECKNNVPQAGPAPGWIKNHYAYCQMSLHGHIAVQCVLGIFRCRTVGTLAFRSILIGYGKKGERRAEFNLATDPIEATGIYRGAKLGVTMNCTASTGVCNNGARNGKSQTVARWMIDNDTWFDLVSPALPPSPTNGEQVMRAAFQPHYIIDAGRSVHDRDYLGPESGLRMDSAWYLTYSEGAIFDRTTPSIAYSLTDEPVKMSARHMNDALKFPDTTYPKVANKHIPGGSADDTIHRLYHNQARRDANRDEARAVCDAQWPGYPDLGQDCDEFPFATTYEGAARYRFDNTPYGMFSVRPINSPDNQLAGSRLGAWYGDDRILDSDNFFVRILP